ncbi:MAG: TonB-dependent receptor plug domain-containing protein [Gemmatimonadaceae bacterium]|nr:TonB-dependent receptor plug domain-containing protein [Chitinophagaceae bacterium]
MEFIFQYILKFSISIAALFLFYKLVLRPLTFYQWHRWYLVGYSLLSFVIPLIDVSPWFDFSGQAAGKLMSAVPAISDYTLTLDKSQTSSLFFQQFSTLDWCLFILAAGSLVMLVRFGIQFFSLMRIRRKATLLQTSDDVNLYEMNIQAGPFSFGNAIYVNPAMHSAEELSRIIQHEYVHVKQKHSADLMIAELVCIVNWFNPFAWLVRHAIRQNLEFIADNKVVQNGIDLKEYQYLLLKVVGIPQYRIANHFNLSNLKKRIAMMNKMRTAKMHLTKFLFVLPMLLLVLLAFRSSQAQDLPKAIPAPLPETPAITPPAPALSVTPAAAPNPPARPGNVSTAAPRAMPTAPAIRDTVPTPPVKEVTVIGYATSKNKNTQVATVNDKGYILTVADNGGECVVIVKDKNKKILKAVALIDWNNIPDYEKQYGKIPPPPPPVERPVEVRASRGISKNTNFDNVLVIIDKVEQPMGNNALSKISPDRIESINILKDASAVAIYGDKAKNGVVEVTTKVSEEVTIIADKIELSDTKGELKNALFIVDGKKAGIGLESVKHIDQSRIGSVSVLKGEHAIKAHGDEGKNGVIIITTKK